MQKLKATLEAHYALANTPEELSENKPDPLLVAKSHQNTPYSAEIALICAMLSYGNAKAIVKMLQSLDFRLLESAHKIHTSPIEAFPYYRFQTRSDIKNLFFIVALCLERGGIKQYFKQAYSNPPFAQKAWKQSKNPYHAHTLYGIYSCIDMLKDYAKQSHIPISKGLNFALGTSLKEQLQQKVALSHNASALKRWNMLLRWLARKDELDMGIWQDFISPKHLILPLDTHTFKLCKQLGILHTHAYNLQSALYASDTLASLCKDDPIKYDFALYRLGQSGEYRHLFV